MKGILVTKFGGPEVLAYRDLDDPQPQANQVLIRVHSAGVNYADVKARTNVHHIKRPLPFIPGLDVAGTIEAVGSKVKKLKAGQRVVAFPQGGSYCEFALAHELLVFPIPDSIKDDTAAAFPVVAGTSYAMLSRIARLQTGPGAPASLGCRWCRDHSPANCPTIGSAADYHHGGKRYQKKAVRGIGSRRGCQLPF